MQDCPVLQARTMHNDSVIFLILHRKQMTFSFLWASFVICKEIFIIFRIPEKTARKMLENIFGLAIYVATELTRSIWLPCECKTNGYDYWTPVA